MAKKKVKKSDTAKLRELRRVLIIEFARAAEYQNSANEPGRIPDKWWGTKANKEDAVRYVSKAKANVLKNPLAMSMVKRIDAKHKRLGKGKYHW